MKHYLDLVPISAKIHKKQSRMSIFCIVLAVFLVTTIFGMADMFIRSQILQAQQESGNWHIAIKNISNEEAAIIASRPDIEVFSPYGVLNYRGDLGYTLGGKDVAICGCDESYITEIWTDQIEEGVFPQTSNEALVTENAKQIMGVAIGDPIAVETPDGDKLNFTISGFMNNTASIMSGDSYGIILNTEDYCAIYPNVSDGEPNDYGIMFFTQFANTRNIQGKIADLKEQCNLSNEQISSNNNLLGLLGQSRVPFLLQVYLAAAVLFVLVMLAGIMMIASSLNSNVAQRTEFFGLMRCIGATPKQVMRLVRKEALSWCRLAIPVGISIGIVVIWVLCAILRFLSPEFFKAMPTFGFSVPSILAGIVVGLVTVLFAAYSPAKKAAKVSPLAAVSGNANDLEPARNAANTQLLKIDTALGIYHAKANRKNLFLMTSSFALSIILFLSFSVTVEFMQHTLSTEKATQPPPTDSHGLIVVYHEPTKMSNVTNVVKERDAMTQPKTALAYLRSEKAKAEQQLRYYKYREKILEHQIPELTRKARVHRLCTRAGMLESFLIAPEELTNDQVMELLKISFRQPEVVLALAKMVHDVHERSNVQNPLE